MSNAGDQVVFEELLHTAERAAQAGRTQAALALLRALTREHPRERRGWLALAELSDDDSERQAAHAQAQALAPQPAPLEQAPADDADDWYDATDEPTDEERRPARIAPWALYALALALLLAVAIPLYRLWRDTDAAPSASPGASLGASPEPAAGPIPSPTLPQLTATPQPTSTPTAQPTAALPPTPQPTLAPGAVAQRDGWSASLLRPDYGLFLDGGLGDQQPRGRFLLVLLALANGGGAPQAFPPAMLVLHDAQGRTYTPAPRLSTAYLATYGRGQRGDLSLENELPPGGGLYSVPVIYDVPADASGLQLSLGDMAGGAWPIGP